jgi:uncharacterized protein (UPF0335 family)
MSVIGHNSKKNKSVETPAMKLSFDPATVKQLKTFLTLAEKLDTEMSAINEDKAELFSQARAQGFDVKAMKELRKRMKKDPAKYREDTDILNNYAEAIGFDI